LNYQSSIHEKEFEILEYIDNIPVILVINKVDLLQQNNINDDNVIRNFDERVPECLKTSKRLMNIRERLMEFRKYIVILSLRQDEDGDRELGIHNLIETTNKCLLSKNLERNPQTLVDYNADKHGLKAAHPIEGLLLLFFLCISLILFPTCVGLGNATMRILLIGYTSTGKSSLINYLAGSNVAAVSSDGLPMTQKIEEYFIPDLNLTLIDSVGLEKKRDNTEKFKAFKNYRQPDFIWFLINYQSALEQDELNLIGELFPLIPTIIVVNFMDILQTLQDDIVFETDTRLNNQQYQIEKQRLLKFKQSQTNVRHIIAMSLRSEEQGDKPRGLKLLYETTIKNFSNDIYL
jgi:tRNA U34 5-carboxymethylaminomethyl modifying GTPase MnmE/TrmE